jgi:hypothetical protein
MIRMFNQKEFIKPRMLTAGRIEDKLNLPEPVFLPKILIGEKQAFRSAFEASFSWRRRLAGGFFGLHASQKRRRNAGATTHRAPSLFGGDRQPLEALTETWCVLR